MVRGGLALGAGCCLGLAAAASAGLAAEAVLRGLLAGGAAGVLCGLGVRAGRTHEVSPLNPGGLTG